MTVGDEPPLGQITLPESAPVRLQVRGSQSLAYREDGDLLDPDDLERLERALPGAGREFFDEWKADRRELRKVSELNREIDTINAQQQEIDARREFLLRVMSTVLSLLLGLASIGVVAFAIAYGSSVMTTAIVVGLVVVMIAVARTKEPPIQRLTELARAVRRELPSAEDSDDEFSDEA